MIARVRSHDWRQSPLGDVADWPPELVTAVSFVLESKFPAALIWGPHLTTIYNDGFQVILGDKRESLGRSFSDIWSETWADLKPIVDNAFAGEATFIEDFPLTIDRFGYPERTNFTFCYSPVRLADGTVAGIIDTVIETTLLVQARARSKFLNDELGHRLKNTMTMVQAIAYQSLKSIPNREVVDAFTDRIQALSGANDILHATAWEGASIDTVVAKMLELHGGERRFEVSGDPLPLGPKAALSFALLLHELSTNAAKYGSLSTGGAVELAWRVEGDDLVVTWRESGGPPARPASRKGFGSRIIDLGIGGTGRVEKRFLDTGFEADFYAPIARLMD